MVKKAIQPALQSGVKSAVTPAFGASDGASSPVIESTYSRGIPSTTSLAMGVPTGIQAGDMLVAYVYCDQTETFTPPAGWSNITPPSGFGHTSGLYYKKATVSDETETGYTWGISSSEDAAGIILRISGANTTPTNYDFDAVGTNNSPTITPSNPNSLLLAFGSHDDTGNGWSSDPSTSDGYTLSVAQASRTGSSTGGVDGGIWYISPAGTGSTSPTFTVDGPEELWSGVIEIEPA